jgi:hypothetical protein
MTGTGERFVTVCAGTSAAGCADDGAVNSPGGVAMRRADGDLLGDSVAVLPGGPAGATMSDAAGADSGGGCDADREASVGGWPGATAG